MQEKLQKKVYIDEDIWSGIRGYTLYFIKNELTVFLSWIF